MNELSIEEMKKISRQIIESEEKEYNISIKVFPLTFIEYYKDYVFTKKFNLVRASLPLIAGGFNDLKGSTIIFLNKVNKIVTTEGKLFKLLLICFHEARHSEQQQFDKYSYEGFFNQLEQFIQKATLNKDYILEHDKYCFEIGANLYGVTKAKEYLKINYPDLYEKYKNEINIQEEKYRYNYLMYDASNTIDRFILVNKISKNYPLNLRNILNKDNPSPVLEIFLNKDNTFKNIKDIIKNDKFKTLDKKIIYAFLSSQNFIKTLDFKTLSEEELSTIKESLEYTNTIYKNQMTINEKAKKNNTITELQYLQSKKNILVKIALLIKALNFTRNETQRQTHIYNVGEYLEIANKELEERRRGY